jgi:two-component system CheB/CheR fusion protein
MEIEGNDGDGVGHPMPDSHGFMIVGIGASAGGVRALKEFFANVPERSGMAYVAVLHLSPTHESQLAEVLQQSTPMPVAQVTEQVWIEPDHVYVIPPNKSLTIRGGSLVLSEVTGFEERRAPIDIFFRTLGETHRENAACVVLSGTGADGSMGLKRVKERGGLAVAQSPDEAEFPDMPRHAIDTALVDYVLPIAEMPARLVAYRDSLCAVLTDEEEAAAAAAGREAGAGPGGGGEDVALASVLARLRRLTGHDFTNYKHSTVRRRIERRIGVTQTADLAAYARHIDENPEEARALLKDLLISVTNFFRDQEAFAGLESAVIPKLFENKGERGHVRAWVAGCATGEEAYTVAMLLWEYAEGLDAPPSVQVFASDIDDDALRTARAGFYTLNDLADVSPERLRRFFTKAGAGYRVRRELRETVLFARHDLLKDLPFSHLDLVTCRNLLIYLNRAGQARALGAFHFSMNPGGYLFLGGSETTGGASDLFVSVNKEGHTYRARAAVPRPVLQVPPVATLMTAGPAPARVERWQEPSARARISYLDLHRRLLEMHAPPSVLVNAEHEIVHLSESAGRYLHLPGGEPSYNLLEVVRPEMRLELRGALFEAARRGANVGTQRIEVRVDDRLETVNLVVRPVLRDEDTARGFLLVVFEPAGQGQAAADGAGDKVLRAVEPLARQLEEELAHVKTQLRMTVEQYEVQQEELRASNEELQTINEELRSTAEELETSTQELQSTNEELSTINEEMRSKVDELSQLNDDLQNLVNSTDIGTVFLDRALRVKLYTPRARQIFNFIRADLGRPLEDITSKLAGAGLAADAAAVLERLDPVEREVRTRDGGWLLMRLLPYRTSADSVEGVVLTFLDITGRKRDEEALRAARESLEYALEAARLGAWDVELTTGRTLTTPLHNRLFGYAEPVAAWGPDIYRDHVLPEDRAEFERGFARAMKTGELELQVRVRWPDGSVHWIHDRGRIHYDAQGRPQRMSGVAADATRRKEVDGLLQASEERLRLLIDSAEDYAIFSMDDGGHIESWNTGAERIFGFTAEEAVGRHTAIIFTPEDKARGDDEQEMRTARANGRAADERWHVRRDGSRFYASGVLSPLGAAPGSGFVKVMRDLTERRRADEELRRTRGELEQRVAERTDELRLTVETMLSEVKERRAAEERARRLVGQLVTAQEDERRRISRDLHDQLGQQLTALRLGLEALRERCGADGELCRGVDELRARAARLDEEVDFLAWEMRPTSLDDLGLGAALDNYVAEWSKHCHVPAEFHAGLGDARLPPQVETCLYRITQEALNNVFKHAQAARVSVILERRDGHAVLVVEDDGVGFDPAEAAGWRGGRGLGLVGMRERAAILNGSVEFESEFGKGTTIFARVPAEARPEWGVGGDGRG